MKLRAKKALHIFGSGLAILGVGFVGWRLYESGSLQMLASLSPKSCAVILGLSVLYGTSSLILGFSWWQLLRHLGCNLSSRWAVSTHGISQLAKYLPGNIFQFAGRQTLGVAAGVPSTILLKSAALELATLAIAGTLIGTLILPLVVPAVSQTFALVITSSLVISTAWLFKKWLSSSASYALILDFLFLLISASIFVVLVSLIGTPTKPISEYIPALIGTYVAAWLGGLVKTGAPAGIGVRESILIFLTATLLPEAELLLIVAINRMVTLSGDCFCFGFAQWIGRARQK